MEAIDPVTQAMTGLFNPRTQNWWDHFRWTDDGLRIEGITPIGGATVLVLRLDDDLDALTVRSCWVLAGWYPPVE